MVWGIVDYSVRNAVNTVLIMIYIIYSVIVCSSNPRPRNLFSYLEAEPCSNVLVDLLRGGVKV